MKKVLSIILTSIMLNTGVSYANMLGDSKEVGSSINSIEKISFSDKNYLNENIKTTVFGLPQNMGPIDRTLRAIIATGLIGTGIYGLTSNNLNKELSIALMGISIIPIATASTGYCPLYQLVGIEYSF
ncbi:MAG: DUF2892 domain-containing protein [Candidatus Woesearchaeota archaeon]